MPVRSVGLWVARTAKVLALLAFFLPWVLVSCNGDPLLSASGYELATGTVELPEVAVAPEGQGQAWWALSAMILIVAGLVLGFVLKPVVRKAMVMIATCAVSLVLITGGMMHMVSTMRAEVAEKVDQQHGKEGSLERQFARMLGNAIRVEVDIQEGFWLSFVALLSGLAGSGVALAVARREPHRPTTVGDQSA